MQVVDTGLGREGCLPPAALPLARAVCGRGGGVCGDVWMCVLWLMGAGVFDVPPPKCTSNVCGLTLGLYRFVRLRGQGESTDVCVCMCARARVHARGACARVGVGEWGIRAMRTCACVRACLTVCVLACMRVVYVCVHVRVRVRWRVCAGGLTLTQVFSVSPASGACSGSSRRAGARGGRQVGVTLSSF